MFKDEIRYDEQEEHERQELDKYFQNLENFIHSLKVTHKVKPQAMSRSHIDCKGKDCMKQTSKFLKEKIRN